MLSNLTKTRGSQLPKGKENGSNRSKGARTNWRAKKGSVVHKLEIEQEANEIGNSVGREAKESPLKAISRKREKNSRE